MTECKQPGTQTTKAFHVSELGEGIKKTGEKMLLQPNNRRTLTSPQLFSAEAKPQQQPQPQLQPEGCKYACD